jgi:SAM-dependent methyltransferase
MVPRDIRQFGDFCENWLIKRFGATLVDSYDHSDYEGATDIVDLNKPFQPKKQYNTIIDCGCIEHVYNAPEALKNASRLCDAGGQIIHVLPGNNFCGHGFWQFSPELFFSLYSPDHGYTETEVFLADLRNPSVWYKVRKPTGGQRAEAVSSSPLYVMCRTVKPSDFTHDRVQQSDYIHAWSQVGIIQRRGTERMQAMKNAVKKIPLFYRPALSVRETLSKFVRGLTKPTSLSSRNPHLLKCSVAELLDASPISAGRDSRSTRSRWQ